MIAHLNGTPTATGDRWIVLEVNDIGYRVHMPEPEVCELSHAPGKVKIHTYMAVREDAITLYGFLHESESELFTVLIGVSGIGPQIALNILSQISLEDFVLAILSGDEKSLVRISGIGQKGAQRLILELRDKMKKVQGSMTQPLSGKTGSNYPGRGKCPLFPLALPRLPRDEAVKVAARGLTSALYRMSSRPRSSILRRPNEGERTGHLPGTVRM